MNREDDVTIKLDAMNRRQILAVTGAAALAAGVGVRPAAAADVTIRQGYQTNIWGMPTYYLMKSGYLEKRGLKTEDFAVPSGNLTMQQMVARQVDLGTYAGPSFLLGHDKGGLIAIAQIETVGATGAMVVRKDLGITKMADLKGKKIANQTGSSIGNIFVDQVGPANGLKKGDFQEVRMDVNNMMAALSAKTVDAMINVEPYNAIAEAENIGTIIMDLSKYDKVPVFMAATPDFVEKNPDAIVAYLKAWLDVKRDVKDNPKKVSDVIYSFFSSKGYKMDPKTFATAMSRVEVDPGFPTDLVPYLTKHAEALIQEKKISAMPDWKKALRTEFMDKARAGS
jgi:ABC-type nitrate/sulfonate/bicarbonate transport system substrate-binding protein